MRSLNAEGIHRKLSPMETTGIFDPLGISLMFIKNGFAESLRREHSEPYK